MALVLKDRVKQAAAAPGTGMITLGATPTGFQSFAAVGNGNTTYFAIVDSTSGDWEVNYGTYTSSGTTLTRNSPPLSSSNAGALVNFTGAVDVFLTYPSENAVWRDTSGVVVQQSFGAITATSAALTTGTVSTTPASNTDIANKLYVDGLVTQGISYHEPVYVESPNTAGNLTATYNNGASGVGATLTNAGTQVALTIDGILMTTTKRVLIYNQTDQTQNGVYTVTTVGTVSTNWVLTRSTDANTYGLRDPNALGYNDAFFVTNGDTGAGETYVCTTTGVITFGTTNITFAQISSAQVYTAGTGLNLTPATTFNISNTGVTANTYGSASAVPVITVNAQGQATGITNTSIAINGTQVSGNITGSAGSVANALTLGTYLTGGSFNGSAAVTATVDATSANTASKVVARDASGNFSAGTITATLSGSSTSATTATNLAGGTLYQIPYQTAAGTTSFITAASGTNTVLNFNGSAFSWSAGTISGVPLGSNLNSLTAGTYLTGTAYNGSAALTWTVDATSANTASKVVARDASGDFSAGTITAALNGNASSATSAPNYLPLAGGTLSGKLTITPAAGLDLYRLTFDADGTDSFYRAGSGNRHRFTTTGGADFIIGNGSGVASLNGNQLLHAGNYNSYAPTLTGTGASGTWGINITGSAGSAGTATTATNLSGGTVAATTGSFSGVLTVTATMGDGNPPFRILPSSSSGSFQWASTAISASLGSGQTMVHFIGNALSSGNAGYVGFNYAGAGSGSNFTSLGFYANDNILRVYNGTYTESLGSMRAPIFYDSNNTSYYADFAGSTSLSLNGGISFATANPYLSAPSYFVIPGGAYFNSGTVYMEANLQARGGVGNDGGAALTLTGGTSGYTQINGSARSPIFYDSDNTGYYLDLNNTSILNTIGFNGTGANAFGYYWAGSGGYPGYQFTGGNGRFGFSSTSGYVDLYIDGNYYGGIDLYGANRLVPLFDANQGGGALYSSILYDTNDTSYYLNPASASSLHSAVCWSTWYFRSNVNTASGSSPPLQAYSDNGSGAIMAFHRAGYYAVNMGLDSDNVLRLGGWSAPANLLQIDMSGNLTMLANVTAYSDERLKKDWDDLPSDFVSRLAHVKSGTYTRIDNEMRQIGVGAQSLQPLMNEAVFENEDGTLSVAYGNAAMASSVELAKYVTALEQRISQLEARL